jgi:hypothetical protein
MNKLEIDERLTETQRRIAAQRQIIASLQTQSENVAAQGDAKKVVAAKKELAAARELLDGYELVLKSCQKAQTEYQEKREPEAEKIRKRLAEDLWPAALVEYERLKRIHGELDPVLKKITGLNNEMEALANQHKGLIGEKFYTPRIPVPPELYSVADAKFEVAPPKLDLRVGSKREQDRLADQLKQQKPTVLKILKHMNIEIPLCPTCGAELLAQRYAMAEDGSKGFASLRCPQHPEQWMEISFPARPPPPGARYPIPSKDPLPLGDIAGSVPAVPSHGLAETPGLTGETKGGKKAK